MENLIARMQAEHTGVQVRTVKSFISKIPSVFTGKKWSHSSEHNTNATVTCKACLILYLLYPLYITAVSNIVSWISSRTNSIPPFCLIPVPFLLFLSSPSFLVPPLSPFIPVALFFPFHSFLSPADCMGQGSNEWRSSGISFGTFLKCNMRSDALCCILETNLRLSSSGVSISFQFVKYLSALRGVSGRLLNTHTHTHTQLVLSEMLCLRATLIDQIAFSESYTLFYCWFAVIHMLS